MSLSFFDSETVNIHGFELPKYGSFTYAEQDWYYREYLFRLESKASKIQILTDIAKAEGETVDKVGQWVDALKVSSHPDWGTAMSRLTPHLGTLERMESNSKADMSMRSFEFVSMFLCSRLAPDWFAVHAKTLADPRIGITQSEIDKLASIPQKEWITNKERKAIVDKIVHALPTKISEDIGLFAQNELNQWKDVEPDTEADEAEQDGTELGKPSGDSNPPVAITNVSEISSSQSTEPSIKAA